MIRLLAYCPNSTDSTSLYRAAGPFAKLRKQMNIDIQYPDAFLWVNVKACDIVFLQRPWERQALEMAQMAKDCYKPVWVDWDDDLLNIPIENPCNTTFRDPTVRKIMVDVLKMADLVTTASEHLRLKLLPFNQNVVSIPNAFDEDHLKGYGPLGKTRDYGLVYWRGSESHIKDILTVEDQIAEVSKNNPMVTFRFHGYLPWFLAGKITENRFHHIKAMDPLDYFKYLKQAEHQVAIVPLEINEFNKCKSNIAWQENTLAGAAVLAPNMAEWQKPGIINYDGPEDFGSLLEEMLHGTARGVPLSTYVTNSLEYITENLTLGHVNKQRVACIEKLVSS